MGPETVSTNEIALSSKTGGLARPSSTPLLSIVIGFGNFLLQAAARVASVGAHVFVYVLHLNLPSVYEERVMTLPQGCVISSLITDWQRLGMISGVILSVVTAILQLQGPANRIEVQAAGFACGSSAAIGFMFSSLLVLSFGVVSRLQSAVSSNFTGADNGVASAMTIDVEAQPNATENPASGGHSWVTVLDRSGTGRIWWNKHVLMALPAIWVAWSGIAFAAFLLLFVWNIDTPTPVSIDGTLSSRFVQPHSDTVQVKFESSKLPAFAVTVCLSVGGVYLTLTIRALQARA